jgi:hypothetical protein
MLLLTFKTGDISSDLVVKCIISSFFKAKKILLRLPYLIMPQTSLAKSLTFSSKDRDTL